MSLLRIVDCRSGELPRRFSRRYIEPVHPMTEFNLGCKSFACLKACRAVVKLGDGVGVEFGMGGICAGCPCM